MTLLLALTGSLGSPAAPAQPSPLSSAALRAWHIALLSHVN